MSLNRNRGAATYVSLIRTCPRRILELGIHQDSQRGAGLGLAHLGLEVRGPHFLKKLRRPTDGPDPVEPR